MQAFAFVFLALGVVLTALTAWNDYGVPGDGHSEQAMLGYRVACLLFALAGVLLLGDYAIDRWA